MILLTYIRSEVHIATFLQCSATITLDASDAEIAAASAFFS